MDFYAPFAEVYEDWSAPMTEDVPHYVALAREADGPVVELAVGTGRVAIPVSRCSGAVAASFISKRLGGAAAARRAMSSSVSS